MGDKGRHRAIGLAVQDPNWPIGGQSIKPGQKGGISPAPVADDVKLGCRGRQAGPDIQQEGVVLARLNRAKGHEIGGRKINPMGQQGRVRRGQIDADGRDKPRRHAAQ